MYSYVLQNFGFSTIESLLNDRDFAGSCQGEANIWTLQPIESRGLISEKIPLLQRKQVWCTLDHFNSFWVPKSPWRVPLVCTMCKVLVLHSEYIFFFYPDVRGIQWHWEKSSLRSLLIQLVTFLPRPLRQGWRSETAAAAATEPPASERKILYLLL